MTAQADEPAARKTASLPGGSTRLRPFERNFPLPRTHCGFPLGNGMFGVLAWGRGETLCLTVNRSDFWDRRGGEAVPGERLFEELKQRFDPADATSLHEPFEVVGRARPPGAFRNTRLPMGRFELRLNPGWKLLSGALELQQGVLTLRLEGSGSPERELRLALHPVEPVLAVVDQGGAIASVAFRPAWEWVGEAMKTRGFLPPSEVREPGLSGWVQSCPEDPAFAALCLGEGGTLWIGMAPGEDARSARENTSALLRRMAAAGHEAFFREVRSWWNGYWREIPKVDLPDPFFESFLALALFKFGAATSPQSLLPAGLQGPWCEEYQMPAWSADYHFNVNVQQIYTLAFAAGKTAHLLPLFEMIDRCQPLFRENARRMVGIPDGLLITHTTDDRGYACGGVGPGSCIDHAVSGWTAQLYWLHYRHTGDRRFLRERAMPFMEGVMRVFEAMLEWRGDRPSLPIGISAEYGKPLPDGFFQRVGANPSYQLACMHMLARALIEGAQTLGREPAPSWIAIREKLPPWTLIGPAGEERIAIWEGTDLEISHRHHSHLACLYPFDSIEAPDERECAIIQRSLERWLQVGMSDWSEWSLPWAAILQAREGYAESPAFLLRLFGELFLNEGRASVYQPRFPGFTLHGLKRLTGPLEQCEIMQLDGTMGFATAVYEMLVHRHRGKVRFFPAIPANWREAAFEEIHLPGPLRASGRVSRGVVRWIALESQNGGTVCIDVPGYERITLARDGRRAECALPLEVTLAPGERIEGLDPRKAGESGNEGGPA